MSDTEGSYTIEDANAALQNGGVSASKKEIRIFMDGAFDLMHFGHMNAFRLARSLGTYLVVGVNSDQSITECKGEPLMNDRERLIMVQSCKFVDEVVPDCPYIMNQAYLNWVIQEYNIDFVVHGDDPCIVDGKDVYATAKACGKFRTIPRTEGISTTDIVGRILLAGSETSPNLILGRRSKFLTTSRLMHLFSVNERVFSKEMRIVYIDGAWDLLHPGHVAMLKASKERGDYLIVGVHSDQIVNQYMGRSLPLLSLHERVLSVLGCRYVDEVLIDAAYQITPEMISTLKLAEVIGWSDCRNADSSAMTNSEDRFVFAKRASIFSQLSCPNDFQVESIMERIQVNQESFQAKYERKMKSEEEFYSRKYCRTNSDQSLL